MSEHHKRGFWLVHLSILIALLLSILPLGSSLEPFRLQWLALVMIHWCLTLPERVGVLWSFGAGLILDVVTGSLLGQHALGLSLIAYLAVELHARVRLFPPWQQSLFVLVLLLADRLLTLWIIGATGQPMPTLIYWTPCFLGFLLWPWLTGALTHLGQRAGLR